MQFLAFGNCADSAPLIQALEQAKLSGALYEDVNDPRGVALLVVSEDPEYFVTTVRQFLKVSPFSTLAPSRNTRCWAGPTRRATSLTWKTR